MKFNFILLAIVIAFIICYFFSKKHVKEGQISVDMSDILTGKEDILIGLGDDYKIYQFRNAKKEWTAIGGKSCCVRDLTYWNNMLLGVGKYDHRLYRWKETGQGSGLWKLATNDPLEWINSIGVWKNQLVSANLKSLFRWTGESNAMGLNPFLQQGSVKPQWKLATHKVIKNMTEYEGRFYIVNEKNRLEILVDGTVNNRGQIEGQWKQVGPLTEALLAISTWNGKLMSVGTDNILYEWDEKRLNWFKKATTKKLIGIVSLNYKAFASLFHPAAPSGGCSPGFKLEPKAMKRCYKAGDEELTWDAAYKKCIEADPIAKTSLAVITSGKENDFVKDMIKAPKWIGCTDKAGEGVFRWPDGTTVQQKGYTNWNQGEPNNAAKGQNYCKQYSSGLWDDNGGPTDPNAKLPYVCSHTTSKGAGNFSKEGFKNLREGMTVAKGGRADVYNCGSGWFSKTGGPPVNAKQTCIDNGYSGAIDKYGGNSGRQCYQSNDRGGGSLTSLDDTVSWHCSGQGGKGGGGGSPPVPKVAKGGRSDVYNCGSGWFSKTGGPPVNAKQTCIDNGYSGAIDQYGGNSGRQCHQSNDRGGGSLTSLDDTVSWHCSGQGGVGGSPPGQQSAKCPSGWQQLGGAGADIPGCGLDGCNARYNYQNIDECANWCKTDPKCKSITWAPLNGDQNVPGKRVCTRYNTATPTGKWKGTKGQYKQIFCKAPSIPGGNQQGGCCFKITGNCRTYPNMNNHDWYQDHKYGGPIPTTKQACAARLASWKGSCNNQNIQMSTDPNCGKQHHAATPMPPAVKKIQNAISVSPTKGTPLDYTPKSSNDIIKGQYGGPSSQDLVACIALGKGATPCGDVNGSGAARCIRSIDQCKVNPGLNQENQCGTCMKRNAPPKIDDNDYLAAWELTGNPSAQGGKSLIPSWAKMHQNDVLNQMYSYCTSTRDGKAESRVKNLVCGEGVNCTPLCKKQSKLSGLASSPAGKKSLDQSKIKLAGGDFPDHAHSDHHPDGPCHKCPPGTYSNVGSKDCIICTKNSTNPLCREGGKEKNSGLVCPAGTSSTGLVVTDEGEPMNLGDSQSSDKCGSPAYLKEKCKLHNQPTCSPACNKDHGRCVGGHCICGHGYSGPTCNQPPQEEKPNLLEYQKALIKNQKDRKSQEDKERVEAVSYKYHEHKKMNKRFGDNLDNLNKEMQELLEQTRKQHPWPKRPRSFLPSEFLEWSGAIPGLLGKKNDKPYPKPIDVGIAIDDRRKIHFRQQGGEKGRNTKLNPIGAKPQIIKGPPTKIANSKGLLSFKQPIQGNLRGYNEDNFIKGGDNRKQLPG